jgi:cytochrome c oxidase subunit I
MAARTEAYGLLAWMATVDHKRIGILYVLTTLVFFLVGGAEALLMRLQLAWPQNHLLSPEAYNQLFTMHGTTMIFLVVMPALIGFANYFVPLMIGARDMAFPRLNALSYWLLLLGGLLLHFSFLAGGAPAAGWFSYTPLSEAPFSSTTGTDYWALSLLVLGIGSIAASVNLVATVLTLRAPGMTIRRLPLFVWMVLVNSILILLALPILNADLVMLLIDRQLQAQFFLPYGDGSPILWQHYFWAFGHPEVYIMILPAFGMISEIIPVFSRKPIFGYGFVAASTVAIAALSLGVWAHHMFTVGLGHLFDLFFAAASLVIAVPTGVKIFNWIATMWGGVIRFTTAMLFATAFLLEFVIGGLSGVTFATAPIDWQMTDSYYVVAHFHYVLFGGTFFALMAAVYYWFPKMTGRLLSERWGQAHFWLTVVGFNLTFFVQHFLGFMGMPRRVFTYPDLPGWGALNLASTLGAGVLGLSVLALLWNIIVSLRRGAAAGENPWQAWTLEWATTSPPPPHNFDRLPPIRGRRPLWDLAHPDQADERPAASPADTPGDEPVLEKNQVSMVSFIVSEAGFFVVLIISYLFYTSAPRRGPGAASTLDPVTTGLYTLDLLASSGTIWWAERSLRRERHTAFRLWLTVTLLLGMVFLVGQGREYWRLWAHGVRINTNLFTTAFFTLTGFHGLHVCGGLVALAIVLGLALGRDFQSAGAPAVSPVALYWHFVDAVWMAVFAMVYLRLLL